MRLALAKMAWLIERAVSSQQLKLLIAAQLVRQKTISQFNLCGPGPSGGMCCDVGPHRSYADN